MVQSDGLADLIMLRNNTVPTICFCHTPLRPVFDPHYQKAVLINKNVLYKIIFTLLSSGFKGIDKLLWQRYNHIIFNSQETKQRALSGKLIKPNQQNISIIHPGVNLRIKPSTTFKHFFLLPGRIMWTKNIELAIKAFIQFKKQNFTKNAFKLVIAGQVDNKSQPYLRKLQQLSQDQPGIIFIINPTDCEMSHLYQTCWSVLSSAFNEDWGLTLLEGNAHGKPVIAIKRGGPTENQVHQKTGLLVDNNIEFFAEALTQFARHPNQVKHMGQQAYGRVRFFSWTHYRATINAYLKQYGAQK
jgi:glycosyltransferase involved in cell wall biosynthesis